jgi:hypothetical protein
MMVRFSSWAFGACLAAAGCAADEPWAMTEAAPAPAFANDLTGAYPVLLRDCSFFACHGSNDRLFRVWGPSRRRLYELQAGATTDEEDRLQYAEMKKTYESAISFVDINDPKRSLILRKGLDEQAGGSGHLGLDNFGRNVYRSADSPGYLTLSRWVFSLRSEPEEE